MSVKKMSSIGKAMKRPSFLILNVALILTIIKGSNSEENEKKTIATCSQDYSPCKCSQGSNGIVVTCTYVSVEQVVQVFQRTSDSELYQLQFNPFYTPDISLPADFLNNKHVQQILIIFINQVNRIVIDPLAFRLTQNYTTTFLLEKCDLEGQKDFDFLNGFERLESLFHYENANIMAFQYTPPLPSLNYLQIFKTPSLEQTVFPDFTSSKLKELSLYGNKISNDRAEDMLAKVGANGPLSTSLIEYVDLGLNSLTSIPERLLYFPKLKGVSLHTNLISLVPKLSLVFASPLEYLYLSRNSIATIEHGAFSGNFTLTEIQLSRNNLTLFEEGVFKNMLDQMVSVQPPLGIVKIDNNPFSCGCELAWLIRSNRHLLPVVVGGICKDTDTKFEDLNPEAFSHCS